MGERKISSAVLIVIAAFILVAIAAVLSIKHSHEIDSKITPLMEEFYAQATTLPYTEMANGTLDYGGKLDDILARRNSVLKDHNCEPGEWRVEKRGDSVAAIFNTYHCFITVAEGRVHSFPID